jgi:hypothetical protein
VQYGQSPSQECYAVSIFHLPLLVTVSDGSKEPVAEQEMNAFVLDIMVVIFIFLNGTAP